MKINSYIDHTLLKPTATLKDIELLCQEAKDYKFATVCVNSCYVREAYEILLKSDVEVCSVVGFPLGASHTEAKAYEAKTAINEGASEIDMVINQGDIKSGKWDDVLRDISSVRVACGRKILKVILETCNLTDDEITKASKIAEEAGADFVKTSTGFGEHGATLQAVKLMRAAISEKVRIKASGGIRDLETAKKYIENGVSRIGTSSGVAIVNGETSKTDY
ncbi:MAG: deoxyribose-phosphate aldolase [Bacteroidota bacterium]